MSKDPAAEARSAVVASKTNYRPLNWRLAHFVCKFQYNCASELKKGALTRFQMSRNCPIWIKGALTRQKGALTRFNGNYQNGAVSAYPKGQMGQFLRIPTNE